MPPSRIRFGLVGYGAWGSHHARAIEKTAGAQLVAIAAQSDLTRAAARQQFAHANVFADFRELVQSPDVDVVDVVLPSFLHYDVAAAALKAGKHVLLEKPMCVTMVQCDQVIRLAEEHRRILAIGHELRLSSLWGKVKALIDEGFIGTPKYVLVELSRRPYRLGAQGWRFDAERVGNWILEEPIHFFDLARWYLQGVGEPERVYAAASSREANRPRLQDNFSAIVNFSGGSYAVVSQTLSAFEHHQTVKITGTKGALWASWSGAEDRTQHPTFSLRAFDGDSVTSVPLEKMAGELFELEDEIASVVRAVNDEGPLAASGEEGRWSVAMCLAAAESVERDRPVLLTELLR